MNIELLKSICAEFRSYARTSLGDVECIQASEINEWWSARLTFDIGVSVPLLHKRIDKCVQDSLREVGLHKRKDIYARLGQTHRVRRHRSPSRPPIDVVIEDAERVATDELPCALRRLPEKASEETTLTVFQGWQLDTSEAEEPRARDVDIAERAGLAEPANIRRLIDKNWDELSEHGEIKVVALAPKLGGRPGREYWLNENQANHVVTFMRTPQARRLRVDMIKLFVAYRQGRLLPAASPAPDLTPMLAAMVERQDRTLLAITSLAESLGKIAANISTSAASELGLNAPSSRPSPPAWKPRVVGHSRFVPRTHVVTGSFLSGKPDVDRKTFGEECEKVARARGVDMYITPSRSYPGKFSRWFTPGLMLDVLRAVTTS